MNTAEILQALTYLPTSDRLKIAETALQLIAQDQELLTKEQRRRQMEIAALSAVSDYSSDPELTIFTDLDSENFYEEPNGSSENSYA